MVLFIFLFSHLSKNSVSQPGPITFCLKSMFSKKKENHPQPGPITLFAPTNAAFDALPPPTFTALVSDKIALQVTIYHLPSLDV